MQTRDLLLMLLLNALWGFNFIASKIGVDHFPPLFFSGMRFALLFVLLLPAIRPVPRDQWPAVLGVAVSMGVLHYAFMFTGLALTENVSAVAIASQLHVPFATLFAVLLLGERIRWRRTLGMLVAFAGVVLIGFDPAVFDHLLALSLVIAASMAMAMNSIMASTLRGVSAFSLQAWMAMVAVPWLFLLSAATETGQWEAVQTAGLLPWGGVVYSCVGASLIGHGIAYTLLTRYEVGLVSTYMLLSPVLAVIFAVLVWGDELGWRLILGGLMTLGGVAVITLRSRGGQPRPV